MENKATVAGYTLGTIAGFAFLAFIIAGFSSCQRHSDSLNARIGIECVRHGGQWIVSTTNQCVQPSRQ